MVRLGVLETVRLFLFRNNCIFVHMIEEYTLALKIFLSAWFVTNFDPIVAVVYVIEQKLPERIAPILYPIQCFKCLTFWSTLIITQDIWVSLASSLIASLYDGD